ncbi:MAG TPA: DNA polymerase/3'-5' exonuclease PolX [Anaerolineales bacterium]|nr:DNA polymerase/3'-5' exonuclease PolX [Anaerolineales bacterium]
MPKMTNQQLAETFRTIADLLEIKGENKFKILAYRKAADSLSNLSQDANELWRQGKLTEVDGVGKAIAEKIDELLTSGHLGFLEKLEAEVPPSLAEELKVPDLGPKKVAIFWKELGITSLAELERAAREGKLRTLPGMGEKSEAKIIAGIEALGRRSNRLPLGRAWPFAQELIAYLKKAPGVQAVEVGGSLRRMRATVGDIDILAAAKDSKAVMDAFVSRKDVARILGKGETKSSVEFTHGLQAQLWVHPPEHWGTALVYATGSKDHNVRLREYALKKGFSLSEHSLERKDGSEVFCKTEEEVYQTLGLPWIPPEMREDRGEVQAAIKGQLPKLIELKDIKADLQMHTTWSDGQLTIRQMAEAAIQHGYKLIAITDHSHSLGVVGGMRPEDVMKQREEIDEVSKDLGDKIYILQGAEVEIKSDGSLDYPDEILAKIDFVLAALHTSLRQPRQKVTERMINAIHNPHVDMIPHPTGRLLPDREGADLDMEAVLAAAAETGVVMEINAHPARLDLEDIHAKRAIELGIKLSINTDAHSAEDMDLMHFGVSTARRAWVEADQVINTWSVSKVLKWLKDRG